MLKKFIAVKNVGKFRNYSAAGDIEFRKLSLNHAYNFAFEFTPRILFSNRSGDKAH
jgi:hypothetical protein